VLAKPSRLTHVEGLIVRQRRDRIGDARRDCIEGAAGREGRPPRTTSGGTVGYRTAARRQIRSGAHRGPGRCLRRDDRERPYRLALSHTMASEEMRFMSGKQFDPNLVTAFIEVVGDYRRRNGNLGDAPTAPRWRTRHP